MAHFAKISPAPLHKLTKALQKMFWVYLTNNFIITDVRQIRMVVPAINCSFIPITPSNVSRVREFREESRVSEYLDKLTRDEMGFFATSDGKAVGSIWATVNGSSTPRVARKYLTLRPNEALIHDIVTGVNSRGLSVAPFMVGSIAAQLFMKSVRKIIVDVSIRNESSLRMMDKAGLKVAETMLYVSALGTLVFEKRLKTFPSNLPQ